MHKTKQAKTSLKSQTFFTSGAKFFLEVSFNHQMLGSKNTHYNCRPVPLKYICSFTIWFSCHVFQYKLDMSVTWRVQLRT